MNYSNMTCTELRKLLKERKLPVSGNKEILVKRLEENTDLPEIYYHQINFYMNSDLIQNYSWITNEVQNKEQYFKPIYIKRSAFDQIHIEYKRENRKVSLRRLWDFNEFEFIGKFQPKGLILQSEFVSLGVLDGFSLYIIVKSNDKIFCNYEYNLIWEKVNNETNLIGENVILPEKIPQEFIDEFPSIVQGYKVIHEGLLIASLKNIKALIFLIENKHFNFDEYLIEKLLFYAICDSTIDVLQYLCNLYKKYPTIEDLKIASMVNKLENIKWVLEECPFLKNESNFRIFYNSNQECCLKYGSDVSEYFQNFL